MKLKRFSSILVCAAALSILSSCREGFNIPFNVGCLTEDEPFAYYDKNGNLTGIEIDIINAIGEDQGLWFEFITSDRQGIYDQLKSRRHEMDCAIGMLEWTSAKEEHYKFVNPAYYTSSLTLSISSTGGLPINSISDMEGRRMAVVSGTLAETYVKSMAEQTGFTVLTYKNCDEAVKAVESGAADAIEEQYPMIQYRIAKKGAALKMVDKGVKNISFAIITQKDEDATLRGYLLRGLYNLMEDGRLDDILKKYLPEESEER